jgi:beta-phosphoglucomutase
MSIIKGLIFDLDGVIVDTAKYHYLAWKRLDAELGFDFTEKDNERLKGISRMESLKILLELGGLTPDEETRLALAEKKNRWYVEYISVIKENEILPGVRKFIESARAAGLKVALGSASKNTHAILNGLKLTNYFDVVIDGNKVSKAKPDPEVFLLAAQELGIAPNGCVVFEDARAGVEAAKKAGMRCIGIGTSLELCEADVQVSGFSNIDLSILNFE